jgi:hypothetical protein
LTKVYGSGHSAVHALRGVDLELPVREGDTVVLYPGENLSDGMRVQRRGQE